MIKKTICYYCGKRIFVEVPSINANTDGCTCNDCVPETSRARNGIDESTYTEPEFFYRLRKRREKRIKNKRDLTAEHKYPESGRGQRSTLGIYGTYTGTPIKLYKPSEDEVIVARYNHGELSYETIHELYRQLREAFGDNGVVVLPQDASLKQMSKQELKELLDFLTEATE